MFPYPPVLGLSGCQLTGLVSHVEPEGGHFWLQRELGAAEDISASLATGSEGVCQVGVGASVMGRWEGAWYRGKVIVMDGDDRAGVLFVDYGNMAFLDRIDMREVTIRDDSEVMAQAIRCRMDGMSNTVDWETKLDRQEFMVKLLCLAVQENKVVVVREVEEELLPEGEDIPVVVTHVDEGEVWVTLVKQIALVDSVMGQMGELEGRLKVFDRSVTVGQMAGGKFSEDGQTYRCVVEEIMVQKNKVGIRFVDFGNRENLNNVELYELPEDLLRVSPLVVCVKVEGVEKRNLEKLIDEKSVTVVVENSIGRFYTSVEKIAMSLTEAVLLPGLVLPLNQHVEGEVVHISQDGVLWFTPSSLAPAVVSLMDRMATVSSPPVQTVVVDQVCTARYSLDGDLYRVKVKEVIGDKVRVFFVDFGNEETKNVEEILEIQKDLLDLVPAAVDLIPARLFNEQQKEVVEYLLRDKVVSVKLSVEGGKEFARIFSGEREIMVGSERTAVVGETNEAFHTVLQQASARHEEEKVMAILGHVETVRKVWVVPIKVQGELDMVTGMLAEQQDWEKPDHVEVGTTCVASFSEDHEMYRAKVVALLGDERVRVRFVDYGNTEEMGVSALKKVPSIMATIKHCAVCAEFNCGLEDSVVERVRVEEELGKEEFLVVYDKLGVARFYRGDKILSFEDAITKDNPSSEEESDDNPTAVTLSYIESVRVVWVTPVAVNELLDNLMGQLANMGDKLVPVTEVKVGNMLVTRYMEDMELYRAIVEEVEGSKVAVLFIDFGNKQVCDPSSLYNLPAVLSTEVLAPAAIKVNIPGAEKFPDNQENREVVETLLEKENLTLNQIDLKQGVFSVHAERIDFSKFLRKAPKNLKISQKSLSFKQSLDCLSLECLREESNQASNPFTDLDQVLGDGNKERQADMSTADLSMSEQALYEEEVVTEISPRRFKASAARNKYSGRWTVGDKVVAFSSFDNRWREGVIHELYKSEAYFIPEDPTARPELVELSYVKPQGVPVDALNKMEDEIGGMRKGNGDLNRGAETNTTDNNQNSINSTTENTKPNSMSVTTVTLTPSLLLTAEDEDLCTFARTGAGSRYLQSLVSPENKKLCEKMVTSILSSNPLRMMTNPVSCFLVQKLIGYIYILPMSLQSDLLAQITINFSKLSLSAYGYHVVKTAITILGMEQRETFILELENPIMLLSLLKSKYGTFVAQACVPYLQDRTVTSLVNSLLGHVVELGCHVSGTFFLQQFLAQWGPSSILNLLVENIVRHLRDLVHHPQGTYVVQALLKARADFTHMAMVSKWVVTNIEAVYKNKPAIQLVRCILYLLSEKIEEDIESQWSKLLDLVVIKFIESSLNGRPLLIQAACHPDGYMLVIGITKLVIKVRTDSMRRMLELMTTYRSVLVADTNGCIVMKNLQG